MCSDITLTNIQTQQKGLSLSLLSFLLLLDKKFLSSFLFVPALTLNEAFAEPSELDNQQKI